jgi:hypothetical protein
MADVQYPHTVRKDAIEDPVRIPDERHYADARTPGDALRPFRMRCDVSNDFADTRFKSGNHHLSDVGCRLAQICDGTP